MDPSLHSSLDQMDARLTGKMLQLGWFRLPVRFLFVLLAAVQVIQPEFRDGQVAFQPVLQGVARETREVSTTVCDSGSNPSHSG